MSATLVITPRAKVCVWFLARERLAFLCLSMYSGVWSGNMFVRQ